MNSPEENYIIGKIDLHSPMMSKRSFAVDRWGFPAGRDRRSL